MILSSIPTKRTRSLYAATLHPTRCIRCPGAPVCAWGPVCPYVVCCMLTVSPQIISVFPERWMTSGNISQDSMAPYLSCFSQLNISPLYSLCHQEEAGDGPDSFQGRERSLMCTDIIYSSSILVFQLPGPRGGPGSNNAFLCCAPGSLMAAGCHAVSHEPAVLNLE